MYVEYIQAITGVTTFVFKNLYKKLFVNSAGNSNAISHNWLLTDGEQWNNQSKNTSMGEIC